MKHRIFVALLISLPLQKTVIAWQKAHAHLPVRWIQPENLHLTLIPPWYTEDVAAVMNLLQKVDACLSAGRPDTASRETSPFTPLFHRVTFGPDPKKPRLIWAEGEAPTAVIELKKDLENILKQTGEKRPFKLHLTLARFRHESFPNFTTKTLDEKIDWQEGVASFVLLESHLAPTGATYTTLASFPL